MTRATTLLFLTLALLVALPGCWSGSWGGKSVRRSMMRSAPDANAKVVTLNIEDRRGRLTAGQYMISDLKRKRGVYDVRRGRGRNEVYVLCDQSVRASSLQYALPEECIVKVVREEREKDLVE
jgi:hypothetical protein